MIFIKNFSGKFDFLLRVCYTLLKGGIDMKAIAKILSIILGTILTLKGIQLLVDFLYSRCCGNAYIETDCDRPF